MPIETLKDALSAGWRVHARCIDGKVDNTRSTAKCHYRAELDLETLVWTRGPHMSRAGLNDRMMCPRCGNRRVNLIFEPPKVASRAGESGRSYATGASGVESKSNRRFDGDISFCPPPA
jgi:hypothetical protein